MEKSLQDVIKVYQSKVGTSIDQHAPGAKLDTGKLRPSLILGSMAVGFYKVLEIAEFGARKYTVDGWLQVPNGIERYREALLRHVLAWVGGEEYDPESKLHHLAHAGWNCMAILTLKAKETK